jgi:uncharacterized membrane protein YczE
MSIGSEVDMQTLTVVFRGLISVLGLALIVLGALFWDQQALTLVPLHMLLGVLFVLCLWGLVAVGFIARLRAPLPLLVLVWSLIVPVFGVAQTRLLAGPHRLLVETAHLLVGLIAMGLGHGLARRISRARRGPVPTPAVT